MDLRDLFIVFDSDSLKIVETFKKHDREMREYLLHNSKVGWIKRTNPITKGLLDDIIEANKK